MNIIERHLETLTKTEEALISLEEQCIIKIKKYKNYGYKIYGTPTLKKKNNEIIGVEFIVQCDDNWTGPVGEMKDFKAEILNIISSTKTEEYFNNIDEEPEFECGKKITNNKQYTNNVKRKSLLRILKELLIA